jgi:hypothetical protein
MIIPDWKEERQMVGKDCRCILHATVDMAERKCLKLDRRLSMEANRNPGK